MHDITNKLLNRVAEYVMTIVWEVVMETLKHKT